MPWSKTGPKLLPALILRHSGAEVVRGDLSLTVTFCISDDMVAVGGLDLESAARFSIAALAASEDSQG
jgi:hypothetical protein